MADTIESGLEARFDAIDEHFAEQRQYIEFAFGTLEKRIVSLDRRMSAMDRRVSGRFESLERRTSGRFGSLERRMNRRFGSLEGRMNGRFESLEGRMNGRFESLEGRMTTIETGLSRVSQQFGAVERKLARLLTLASRRRRS